MACVSFFECLGNKGACFPLAGFVRVRIDFQLTLR
jgi:hypothetical protein